MCSLFGGLLTEGDEGPLSFPFDEPLMGEEVIEVRSSVTLFGWS